MSEVAKARDWLVELGALIATDQLDAFEALAKEALAARPDLEDKVLGMAAEYTTSPKQEKSADFFCETTLPKDVRASQAQPKPAPFRRLSVLEKPKTAAEVIAGFTRNEAKKAVEIKFLSGEDRKALLLNLAKVFRSDKTEDRLRYNTMKAEIAEQLDVNQMDVHRATMPLVEQLEEEAREPKLTQAQKAIALTFEDKFDLWIDPLDRSTHASIEVDGHCENYRIGEGAFEGWIRAKYGSQHWNEVEGRRVPAVLSNAALQEGLATMKALAQARGKEITPMLRVGGNPEEVWLDLGRWDWELVRVTKEGWKFVLNGVPSVRFIRKPGMLALPMPVRGGNIRELRPFLNLRDEDFVLDVGWLLGALRPKGPYAIAIKSGQSNSAKTSGVQSLKRMIDPNYADLQSFKSEDDMYIGANSSWVQAYDNISRIRPDDADVMCRISTGIGYGKRALRTDADQYLMRVCRSIVLNGIPNDLAERGDLATRVIVEELPTLDEETQKFEEEFWQEYETAHPRILGALLDGVAGAMRGYREVSLRGFGTIRLPDFARWAEAGCRALGFEKDQFLTAFTASQEQAMRIAFNQDLVARAVALLIDLKPEGWRGNTKPLLEDLEWAVRKAKQRDILEHKAWPKNDVWLGRLLRRSATVLRKVSNIEIEFGVDLRPTGEGDKDGIEIKKGAEH